MSPSDLRALSRAASSRPAAAVPRPPSRWRTRVLVPLAILLATAGVVAYAARDALRPAVHVTVAPVIPKAANGLEPTAAAIDDAPADHRLGAVLSQAPGWVEPDPFAITVPALAEGVVREVPVLEGQTIAAGDVVARLIDDDARLAVRASEAQVDLRQAEVEQARAAIATAESQVRVETSLMEQLRDEINRKRELVGVGVAAGEYRRLELQLEGSRARVAAAEQTVTERRAAVTRAEVAVSEALVFRDEARLRLDRMTVTSPVSGVVLERLVEPGNRLGGTARFGKEGMESAVVRVYDPAHLQVRVDVPLADAGKVGVGTVATVTTEVVPDTVMRGVVTRVVHEANIQRNTVQFKVRLDDPPALLKPEMLTRVKFHGVHAAAGTGGGSRAGGDGETSDAAILVPVGALMNAQDDRADVWITEPRGTSTVVRKRQITFRTTDDNAFVIAATGLQATDKVVVRAPVTLREGDRVEVETTDTGGTP